ncbi:MAG: protein-L-isoaspartate O-methyltransferase [Proteobacteria bacterium]|nr:protein-L-isoaspartate O-methyltransferase [Pseudomonadota bacterium]
MDFAAARQQMVHQQVRAWDVLDPGVLDVLGYVPREQFVPAAFREMAFADGPIPLPAGQTMLAPKIHGRILQALDVKPGEAALEIGAGSGYLSACLAALGAQVTSLECVPELARLAADNLRATGHPGVALVEADATAWPASRRFDAIALTASLPMYDARYQEWLAIGGRLFVVVGSTEPMSAQLVTRTGEHEYLKVDLFETVVDPLLHARRPSRFVF